MTFVAIDWSGARAPRGTIWLAEAQDGAGGSRLRRLEALDSREAAVARIQAYGNSGETVAIGIDFSFSLPAWFCAHVGASCAPDLWDVVATDGEAWLRTCAWPFWGRPGRPRPDLPAHLRRTEEAVGRQLRTKPKSTFQIGGAGAVGTGSLRGMPCLKSLRRAGCSVWPFDKPGLVTVFEMYPRAMTGEVVKSRASARSSYLRAGPWRWSEVHLRAAVGSQDAFDAAISALRMSDCRAALQHLPSTDALAQIEGEMWTPIWREGCGPLTAEGASPRADSSRP